MAVPIRTAVAALCASLAAALLTTAPAQAEQHDQAWSLSAGAHAPRAQVTLDDATGTLSLAVSRDGRTVIDPSPVGILTERADLSKDLRFLHRKSRTVHERYRAKSGKRLDRLVRMNETRLSFATAAGAASTSSSAPPRTESPTAMPCPRDPVTSSARRPPSTSRPTRRAGSEPTGWTTKASSSSTRRRPRPPASTQTRPCSRPTAATPCSPSPTSPAPTGRPPRPHPGHRHLPHQARRRPGPHRRPARHPLAGHGHR